MVEMNLELARHNMIQQQIRPWEVLDERVLDLILQTPREDFVPAPFCNLAFVDMEVDLGHGQRMMAPKIEARMLQALNVQPGERVLEVGTGSGFVTALLAKMAGHVYSVEIVPELKEAAERRLRDHGIGNVTLEVGDAATGWPQHGLYNAIAVTGSLPELAEEFRKSLEVGGRLFAVVGEAPVMEALLITRTSANAWHTESLFETVLAPLLNAPRPKRFTF